MYAELAHNLETDDMVYRTKNAGRPVRVVRNDLIQNGRRLTCRVWVRFESGRLDTWTLEANEIVYVAEEYAATL